MKPDKRLKAQTCKFMTDVLIRVDRAREQFPGSDNRLAALVEEVGEVATVLQENQGPIRLYDECLDVAVTALRLALEGDSAYPLTTPQIMELGPLRLAKMSNGKIWLQHRDGEGGEFPAEDIANLVEKHFWEKF